MGQLLGQCVGLISGERWRTVRSIVETPFLHRNIDVNVDSITQHVEKYFANIEQGENMRSGKIHPAQDLKFLPFWIVAELFYGTLSDDLVAELNELIPLREEFFMKHVIRGGLARFAWMRFFPTEAHRALADFKTRWAAFNRRVYEHARTAEPSAAIVQMFEAVEQGTISHEQLYQTIDEALFANLDVTIGGVSWNLVFMAAYSDAQERLRSEVQHLSADESSVRAKLILVPRRLRLRILTPEAAGRLLRPAGRAHGPESWRLRDPGRYELYRRLVCAQCPQRVLGSGLDDIQTGTVPEDEFGQGAVSLLALRVWATAVHGEVCRGSDHPRAADAPGQELPAEHGQ